MIHLLSNLRNRVATATGLAVVGALGAAPSAFAVADPDVGTAVSGAGTTLGDTAQAALPVVAAVAVAMVLLGFVKKLIRKAS